MSLRLRLALWYGALTGLVVLAVSLLTYSLHSRAHYDDLDRVLVGAGQRAAAALLAAPTLAERAAVISSPLSPQLVLRLYGPGDRVLAQSPGAQLAPALDVQVALDTPAPAPRDLLVRLAPPLSRINPGPGTLTIARGASGDRWRAYVLPLAGTREELAVLAPLGDIDTSVQRLGWLAPLLASFGAATALVAGWLLARSALRPVAALTETARAISRSRDFKRRVPGALGRDELGRLAATFDEMLDSLDQAYQSQQRFVSDASHELRAPLTAIQANLELLERRPRMPEADRQEAIGEALREARRLAQLVADLLALARADAGVPLRRQRVELDRLVLEVVGQVRHLAQGQEVAVDRLEPALAEGDPDRLKQLLLALADNATKYTPPGGRITLDLRRVGGCAQIRVADTGVGIPPEELPHVFERFYRADPARSRDPGGTGLGLPIARWIAQQHGGDVWLESTLGLGTTATIRLPLLR